ncbi:coiled-coil domain-containing protein 178 [Rhea pennata]|uniref:coiled-coil domain-containing protein 178 n=1 Tax=Rhea pennata TaxID=8795 RepID=UPI002E25A852
MTSRGGMATAPNIPAAAAAAASALARKPPGRAPSAKPRESSRGAALHPRWGKWGGGRRPGPDYGSRGAARRGARGVCAGGGAVAGRVGWKVLLAIMLENQSFSCSSKDTNEPCKSKCIATRQRSCAFVNTPLPCINKAIHHIRELEVKMEKCFQQYDRVFKEEEIPWITEKISAESNDTWLSLSTRLDFQDVNISFKDSKTLTLKLETKALLLEVTELIKRLDADCREAEKALEQEKQRGKKLSMKLDCMSLWRLQQLPAAVQKEYETCTQDILELQWHFDCKSCQLQQVENQVLKIETVNKKIQEEIDFMKKHSPLLEEKLNLEGEAMKDVLLAYEKASKIYSDVHCELVEIQKTMKRIDEEAEKEIKSMSQKIKYAEMVFSQYKSELKHSEFTWTKYCKKLKEAEEKIIKDEEHLEELVKQKADIQEDAKSWNSKIEDLNNKIAAQGNENIKISDACSEVITATEKSKSTWEGDLQTIKQKLLNISEALNDLKCENEALQGENEEFLQKSANSSRKKKAYQSEIKTVSKSIQKIEEQVKRVNKDLYNVELSYGEKKAKYEDLQKKITSEKINYKHLEVNIKKEIQEQKGIWKKTQAAIKAIYGELEEKRKERLRKKEEDTKMIEEIERPVADLEKKVGRSKDIFKENHEKLLYLDERVQEVDKQQKQTERQLEQRSTVVQQQLNDIQEKYSVVYSQIAETSHITESLKNELRELNALWNMKEMQLEKTEKSLTDLGKNLSAVISKQQNVQMAFNYLQDELAEYEKRLKQEEKIFGELRQTRKKKLKDLEATLEQIIKENLWLAQEYNIFQNYYLNDKENLTVLYDSRIKVEAAVRDHHQLRVLRSRTRGALAERWRQRGLRGRAALAGVQAASQENAHKILAVQGELSKTIQHITAFLHSLTDGSSAVDSNANNQGISDAEGKDKKSHTVQITV